MVKIRTSTRCGVTAKFVGGRFAVIHNGVTEWVALTPAPRREVEIMQALECIVREFAARTNA